MSLFTPPGKDPDMSEASFQEKRSSALFPIATIDEIEKLTKIVEKGIQNVKFIKDNKVRRCFSNCVRLLSPLKESIRKFCSIARLTPESEIVETTKANLSEYLFLIPSSISSINESLKSASNSYVDVVDDLDSILNDCKYILEALNVYLFDRFTFDTLQEDTIIAYQKYKSNASRADLDNMHILNKIKSKIELLGRRRLLTPIYGQDDFPFIAIVGPSFMGKTQLAFTLARTHPVLYFNFMKGESRQHVYKSFEPISTELESCLSDDLKKINGRDNCGAALSIILRDVNENIKYKSLGLIYALLEKASSFNFNGSNVEWMSFYLECGPFAYSEMTFKEYYKKTSKSNLLLLGF